MPQFPESLDPKARKSTEARVQIEWATISYRSVALVIMAVVLLAAITLYFLFPEKIKAGVSKLLRSGRKGSGTAQLLQKQAHFVNIEGNVRVKKANAVQWVAASPDLPLEKGDVVQASSEGLARITFADGTTYTVRPETLIVVEENSGMADSKATNVAVQVTSGEVDLSTTKFEGQSRVVFANAQVKMGQDSRARVKNDPKTQVSEFTMAQGSSEILRGTQSMTLGSYEQVSFRGDGPMARQRVMGPPLLLIPSSNAPVISTGTDRSEVTFNWTPVPSARSYRLRISNSPIFTTVVYDKRVASSTVKVPLPLGTYYWAVSSLDERNQESQTSDASKFTLLQQGQGDEILLEVDNFILHGKVVEIVGRTEPGARIMVNDEPVFAVMQDGTFKHFTQPFPNPGANHITVTAQNSRGQIATRRKTVYIQ